MKPNDKEKSVLEVLKETPATVRYLLLGAFINQLGYFIQAYLLVFMLSRNFTVIQAGWALALLGSGAILGTLIGASLGSRMGNRNAIALATSAMGVSVALIPFLVNASLPVVVWGASIFITGLFAQMYRPAAATILSKHMPQAHQVMGFSMFRIAINLGAAVGPVLATLLAKVDWSLVFWLNAACSLAYAGIALTKLPQDETSAAQHGSEHTKNGSASWGYVLKDAKFWAFLLAMFLSSIVYMQIYSTLPVAIESRGLPLETYSLLLTVSAAIIISLELKISSVVRRFPGWIPATVGTTVLCLGVASFGLTLGSNWLLILSMVVMVSGLMTSGPTMFAYPASFPQVVRAKYIGANQAMFSAGNALGPVIGVAIFREFDSFVWVFCFILALVSGALVIVGMRPSNNSTAKDALPV